MMEFVAYTMEYCGGNVSANLRVRNYLDRDFDKYKRMYEECFFEMRTALGLFPICCCDGKEELLEKHSKIFILEIADQLIGSVAIYGNEIDDLIVAKEFQRKGYGKSLLQFSISFLQKHAITPILLHTTAWNQNAIKMYLDHGFKIVKTQIIQ